MPSTTSWIQVPSNLHTCDGQIKGSTRAFGIKNKDLGNLSKLMAGLVRWWDWIDVTAGVKPSDFAVGVYYYPFNVGYLGTPESDDIGELAIGSFLDTNVTAKKIYANTQYYSLGQVYIARKFGNFLDYNGYTKFEIFLPYYGFITVNPNDIMEKYMQFRLKINLLTGVGTYIVGVSNDGVMGSSNAQIIQNSDINDSHTRIIGTYDCQIGALIPTSEPQIGTLITNTIMSAVKGTASIITGSLPQVENVGSTSTFEITKNISKSGSETKLGPFGVTKQGMDKTGHSTTGFREHQSTYVPTAAKTASLAFDAAQGVIGTLIPADKGGTTGNTNFMYMSQSIKIVRYTPILLNKDYPDSSYFSNLFGKPLGKIKTLRDIAYPEDLGGEKLDSYVEVSGVHLHDFGRATANELTMIEELLHNGVIL